MDKLKALLKRLDNLGSLGADHGTEEPEGTEKPVVVNLAHGIRDNIMSWFKAVERSETMNVMAGVSEKDVFANAVAASGRGGSYWVQLPHTEPGFVNGDFNTLGVAAIVSGFMNDLVLATFGPVVNNPEVIKYQDPDYCSEEDGATYSLEIYAARPPRHGRFTAAVVRRFVKHLPDDDDEGPIHYPTIDMDVWVRRFTSADEQTKLTEYIRQHKCVNSILEEWKSLNDQR